MDNDLSNSRMEGRRGYVERMISVSLAWFVYIEFSRLTFPHINAELAFLIRTGVFLAGVVTVLDALIARLAAAGLPRPELLALLYGGALLLACEQLGRSGPAGLMLTPWLFLALSVPGAMPRSRKGGRDIFRLNMSRAAYAAVNAAMCCTSVVGEVEVVRSGGSIAGEIVTAVAAVWFAWRMRVSMRMVERVTEPDQTMDIGTHP